MRTTLSFLASLALCLLVLSAGSAQATSTVKNNWLSNYPGACNDLRAAANDCSLCHGSSFSFNAYGNTLRNMSFSAAESVDSDGDGRTNGEEILVDCTLPGNQASPDESDSWGAIKALFR